MNEEFDNITAEASGYRNQDGSDSKDDMLANVNVF